MIYFLATVGIFVGWLFGAISNFIFGPFAVPALVLVLVTLIWVRKHRRLDP